VAAAMPTNYMRFPLPSTTIPESTAQTSHGPDLRRPVQNSYVPADAPPAYSESMTNTQRLPTATGTQHFEPIYPPVRPINGQSSQLHNSRDVYQQPVHANLADNTGYLSQNNHSTPQQLLNPGVGGYQRQPQGPFTSALNRLFRVNENAPQQYYGSQAGYPGHGRYGGEYNTYDRFGRFRGPFIQPYYGSNGRYGYDNNSVYDNNSIGDNSDYQNDYQNDFQQDGGGFSSDML
jgi:hypothetical protein